MIIRFLGTHNEESRDTRLVSILVDGVLAVDAGSLTEGLSFAKQEKIKAILLSHGHYDHIRDIPAFVFNNSQRLTRVFASQEALDVLSSHLVDGLIYPNFAEESTFLKKRALELCRLEPLSPRDIEGYTVTAVPLNHPVGALGFEITSPRQERLLYATDTGPGLHQVWQSTSPQLLIIDTTYPDRLEKAAWDAGHLCPKLLLKELNDFRSTKGYLPRVASVHLSPGFEAEIRDELKGVSSELGITIEIPSEGDTITI
jgi:ribonuclease BN (tRNA processing enzyme)